ncbi:MAG: serine/threonine protein kinase [Deltaproteobacteria bacterium]|nr:serine/threonine protein kinase [Deltaproteobacteria bacterium]
MARASPPLAAGTMVDQYRVIWLLGRGGMAEVYLARDMILGRRVAIKLLHPTQGLYDVNERFMIEARATARFNHPNIVTVHGVGEHDGRPYLALEYVEGQTLRDRLRHGPAPLPEILRIALAISEALREAHRRRILHRDLKPSNVIIGRDARVRVVDFGLAKRMEGGQDSSLMLGEVDEPSTVDDVDTIDDAVVQGTPAYMAPEQWQAGQCTEATDAWAFGMLLYEMANRAHPFHGLAPEVIEQHLRRRTRFEPLDPALPAEFRSIVTRCLEWDPRARPDAAELVAALDRMLSGPSTRTELEVPFRGLQAYGERHSDRFCGRDAESGAFVERLREQPVLPVVGPSGCGKSSFVQAGVIPRLREQRAWTVLRMRPGRRPLLRLVRRVSHVTVSVGSSSGRLPEPPPDDVTTREERIHRDALNPTSTQGAPDPMNGADDAQGDTEQQYAGTGEGAALQERERSLLESPARLGLWLEELANRTGTAVLLFVDQLEELYTLVSDERERQAFLDALSLAADEPAGPVRVVFTLRDDFLGRVAETRAMSDVLTHVTVLRSPGPSALREILVRPVRLAGYGWEDESLVDEMLQAVRGEPAALPLLQFAAQMLWEHRDSERRVLTRAAYDAMGGVVGSLAHHADGVLATLHAEQVGMARDILLRLISAEGNRLVVPRTTLLEGLAAGAAGVLERLTETRAVVVHRGGDDRDDAEVELVHESLVRTWDRLRRWLEASREEVAFVQELQQAADAWKRRGGRSEETWRGDALRDAFRRCEHTPLPDGVKAFLETGRRLELRRSRTRRFTLAAVMVGLCTVAIAFWAAWRVASRQRAIADTQRIAAEERRAEALRQGAKADLRHEDMLEARAKLRSALETQDSLEIRSLWWDVGRSSLQWRRPIGLAVNVVAATPDGSLVAAAGVGGTVHLTDRRGMPLDSLRGQMDQVVSLALSKDGQWIAAGIWNGTVDLWHVPTATRRVLQGHTSLVRRVAFSADGNTLASGSDDRTLRLWRVQDGSFVRGLQGHLGEIRQLAFHPQGNRIASADLAGQVRVWSVHDGSLLLTLSSQEQRPVVAWTLDGNSLLVGGQERVRELRADIGTESRRWAVDGHVMALVTPADGRVIVSQWTRSQHVRVKDLATGQELADIPTTSNVTQNQVTLEGGTGIVVGGEDQVLRFWNLRQSAKARRIEPNTAPVYALAVDPQGRRIASGGRDRTLRISESATGVALEEWAGHTGAICALDFSADGNRLVSGAWDHSVRLWNLERRSAEVLWANASWPARAVAMAPDGLSIAATGDRPTIRVLDVKSASERMVLTGHDQIVLDLDYSPDGRWLASGGDPTVRLWDAKTGRPHGVLRGHRAPVRTVRFSPDGRWIASGGDDATIRLWDVASGRSIRIIEPLPDRVMAVAFHPDGQRLGVALSGGGVGIWSVTGERLASFRGHRSDANAVLFAEGGSRMLTAGDDATVRSWNPATGRPMWFASTLLLDPPEAFSHEGWVALGPPHPPARRDFAWRKEVENHARFAVVTSDGSQLCIAGYDDRVARWLLREDRNAGAAPVQGLRDLVALPWGCVGLSARGDAVLVDSQAQSRILASGVAAIGVAGDDLLVGVGHEVRSVRAGGEAEVVGSAEDGLTSIARIDSRIVAGYRDGRILLSGQGRHVARVGFEDVPAYAVERLIAGPPGTLVSGFSNGVLGVWDLRSGASLYRVQMHGPVTHVAFRDGKVFAATELGDHESFDLGVFYRDYCDLLREVWRDVPVVWEDGHPTLRAAPAGHRCAPKSP